MANISTDNINTLAQVASSIGDGDYIYIFKGGSGSFSRIEKSVFLAGLEVGGFSIANTSSGDLEFADSLGNVVMRLVGGHIVVKNFSSSNVYTKSEVFTKSEANSRFALSQALDNYYTKSQVDDLVGNDSPSTPPENLKILFLGNSFTTGTFSYLPFMLKNYGVNVTIHILYSGGAGIDTYNSGFTTANKTMYSINTATDTAWAATANQSASAIVASKAWDMVVLQQGSSYSYTYSNYSNVGALMTKVRNASTNSDVKFGWVINHIGPSSFTGGTDNRPNVVNCCEQAIEDNDIDFVFPYGTAIFNLMDKFSTLGDGTYMTYDGLHLQEGFPRYAAACANLQALFEGYYPKLSVLGDIFIPDATHRNNANGHVKGNIIGMDGNAIEVGSWAMASRIAQFAALAANRNKFNINAII